MANRRSWATHAWTALATGGLFVLGVSATLWAQAPPDAAPSPQAPASPKDDAAQLQKRVSEYVEALKSEDYKTREAAERALKRLGKAALPHLKKAYEALKDKPNPDLEWRLQDIIDALQAGPSLRRPTDPRLPNVPRRPHQHRPGFGNGFLRFSQSTGPNGSTTTLTDNTGTYSLTEKPDGSVVVTEKSGGEKDTYTFKSRKEFEKEMPRLAAKFKRPGVTFRVLPRGGLRLAPLRPANPRPGRKPETRPDDPAPQVPPEGPDPLGPFGEDDFLRDLLRQLRQLPQVPGIPGMGGDNNGNGEDPRLIPPLPGQDDLDRQFKQLQRQFEELRRRADQAERDAEDQLRRFGVPGVPTPRAPVEPPVAPADRPVAGATFKPLPEAVRLHLHLPERDGGVWVDQVGKGRLKKLGVQPADVILSVNGFAVHNVRELEQALDRPNTTNKRFHIDIIRRGKRQTLTAKR